LPNWPRDIRAIRSPRPFNFGSCCIPPRSSWIKRLKQIDRRGRGGMQETGSSLAKQRGAAVPPP
jgi:hypothetical protein